MNLESELVALLKLGPGLPLGFVLESRNPEDILVDTGFVLRKISAGYEVTVVEHLHKSLDVGLFVYLLTLAVNSR